MKQNYTKEEIYNIICEASQEVSQDIMNRFANAMNQLSEKEKEDPARREVICISLAIQSCNQILADTLRL